jgi:protein MpaA
LLVVGGIHGDEPASVEAVVELVGRLRGARAARGALVLPALNPDGLAAGRKNSDADVDLNRNFPARSFSSDHVPGYHPGPRPLSEPETELLAEVVHSGAIEAVLAVHAPFSCVNFDGPARRWAETVSAACGWPLRESIGYPTPGSLGSWLGVDRGLPILTLELPPGSLDGFRAAAAAALDAAVADVGD